MTKKLRLILPFLCLIVQVGWGQILTFEFDGLAGNETTAGSNFNHPNLTASTISRGAGLTASNNADRFNATNWALTNIANAVSGNKYMEFTITPTAGYQFSVSSITINLQRSGTGPREVVLRSSVDGYATNLDGAKTIIDNTSTQSFTFTFAQANSSTAITYRFYMWAEATGGSGGIGDGAGNDLVVNGTVTATGPPCTVSITNFTPASGPAGTRVTLTGTGFSSTSTVSFDGTPASSVSITSATTLTAVVPAGSGAGAITVQTGACSATSTNFVTLSSSGTCGIGLVSDLIISEVYDRNGGTAGFIEIYNGMGSTLTVAQLAAYQIRRRGDIGGSFSAGYDYTLNQVGADLPNGQVFVIGYGTTSDLNAVFTGYDAVATTSGINANDELELYKNAAPLDEWHETLNKTGYTFIRQNTVSAPNTSFTAAEWTASGTESTANLGTHTGPVGTPTPTITTQPTDQNGCTATFTIAASGTTLTYQWYYHIPAASGWLPVPAGTLNGATIAGQNTNVLGISGDLTNVNGYQFFCQVSENGACFVASNAALLNLNPGRFYRSRATGNWNAVSTWQSATTSGGSYTNACLIPNYDNSDEILIRSPHTVTATADLTGSLAIDQTQVLAGGSFVLNDINLDIHNGSGVDLDIQGTIRDNASSGKGLNFAAGASWQLGSNGTVIKTRNSSVVAYRDNYQGGIANIPATASWYYQYEGNALATVAVNMFYPNLYFISNSGAYNGGNFNAAFTGSTGGFATVKGNFEVGTQGTGTVAAFNNNINAQPMRILGNLIVGSGSTLTNASYDGGSTSSRGEGKGFEVQGNVTVNGTLVVDNQIATAADNLLLLSGGSTQTVSGTGTFTVHHLQINNNSAGGVVLTGLSAPLQVRSLLTLTNGRVRTNLANGLLQLNGGASVVPSVAGAGTAAGAGSLASFVDGPLRKVFAVSEVGAMYALPIGKGDKWGPAGILPSAAETFTAEFFANGYGTYDRNFFCFNQLSSLLYWQIDRTGGNAARVRLYWKENIGIAATAAERNQLRIARFNGTIWEGADAPAACSDTDNVAGDQNSGYVETNANVASFSPFTISSPIPQNPLPVRWTHFEATLKSPQQALLRWQTAWEQNNAGFFIEKSSTGTAFEQIGFVPSRGQAADYTFVDDRLRDCAYYRLRQQDHDGASTYSKVVFLKSETSAQPTVFPNPFAAQITLQGDQQIYRLCLRASDGRQLLEDKGQLPYLTQQLNAYYGGISHEKALYFLELHAPDGQQTVHKLIRF
ncbi:MAG: IPT/TIG domain-containing protein [Bernardetiaceae bacterium]